MLGKMVAQRVSGYLPTQSTALCCRSRRRRGLQWQLPGTTGVCCFEAPVCSRREGSGDGPPSQCTHHTQEQLLQGAGLRGAGAQKLGATWHMALVVAVALESAY
jgi:hypothetical protein